MGKYDDIIDNPKKDELIGIAEINELAERNRLVRLGMTLQYRLDKRPILSTKKIEDTEFDDKALPIPE